LEAEWIAGPARALLTTEKFITHFVG